MNTSIGVESSSYSIRIIIRTVVSEAMFRIIAPIFASILLLFNTSAWGEGKRFTDNRDGTITDSLTGLLWQKQDSYHDLKKAVNWYDAFDYADRKNNQRFAGHSDWRLPTLTELKSL